jgi:hypothetical protein
VATRWWPRDGPSEGGGVLLAAVLAAAHLALSRLLDWVERMQRRETTRRGWDATFLWWKYNRGHFLQRCWEEGLRDDPAAEAPA